MVRERKNAGYKEFKKLLELAEGNSSDVIKNVLK